MIISASRRTDIPAFYHKWFMNRIRAGFLLVRNPYNSKQIRRVSLHPSEVDAIVFWTRNPINMLPSLPILDEIGYKYYFQYTITGYSRVLERHTPHPQNAIRDFCRLSDYLGKGRVVWRYDPILLCNVIPLEEHKRLFSKIARQLSGKTERVVISFADLYKKTDCNLKKVANLNYSDILLEPVALGELLEYMKAIAAECGMTIYSCAEDVDLDRFDIKKGKCIDDKLLKDQLGVEVGGSKDSGQREACGCVKSIDIGQYNTCKHGCTYCYATFNQVSVDNNWEKHDEESPFLIGDAAGVDMGLLIPEEKQITLF